LFTQNYLQPPRNPYVKLYKDQYYDKYGNPVSLNDPLFQEKVHIPLYELTESTIINFF